MRPGRRPAPILREPRLAREDHPSSHDMARLITAGHQHSAGAIRRVITGSARLPPDCNRSPWLGTYLYIIRPAVRLAPWQVQGTARRGYGSRAIHLSKPCQVGICQCCAQGKDAARPESKRRCCVALRLSSFGAVAWFVTGSGTRPGLPESGIESLIQCPNSSGCCGAADGSPGSRLTRSRSILAKSSPTHSSGSPATEATA